MNHYPAKIVRVIDGDTLDCVVDLGFKICIKVRLRLNGIDTPELRSSDSKERELAKIAKQFVIDWVSECGNECQVWTYKTGKYGRWLADIKINNRSLNQDLLDSGHAVPYK